MACVSAVFHVNADQLFSSRLPVAKFGQEVERFAIEFKLPITIVERFAIQSKLP